MRRVFLAFLFVLAFSFPTFGQGNDNTFRPTATPPTPTCPFHRVFLNVSGQLAKVDCAGVVTLIGSGGGGSTPPGGPSGAVQYNASGVIGGDYRVTVDATNATLTLGATGTPGAVKLSGINNNVVVLSVQNPAANRTYYWPDNTPTVNQALVAQSVGATVTLGFANVLQGSLAANQIPVGTAPNTVAGSGNLLWNSGTLTTVSNINFDTGVLAGNNSAGNAAQAVIAASSNTIAGVMGATSSLFATAGQRRANQVYFFGSSGAVEMLHELGDGTARFVWAAGGAERGRWDTTGLGIGVVPSTKLDVDSAIANDSGVRLRRLTSASPTSAGQPIGVDANGKIVTVAGGGGGGGAPTTASYLVAALDGTLSNERRLLHGTGLLEVDNGPNADFLVSLDYANPSIWTTIQTFKPGTTSTAAIRLGMDAPGSVGQLRDGHYIELQGASNDGSAHTASFRILTDMVSPDGQGAELAIRHRLDTGSITNALRVVSDGSLIALGALYSGSSAVQATTSAGNLRPQAFASADKSGNSEKFATFTGATTGGRCAEWDAFGNLVQSAGGCGGTPALTATQVGFGNGSNLLTGSASFTYQDANGLLTLSKTQNALAQITALNASTGVNGGSALVAQSSANAVGLIATGSGNTAYGANLALLRAESGFSSLTIQTAAAVPVILSPNLTEILRVDTTSGTTFTAPGGAGNSGLKLTNFPNINCLGTNATGVVVSGSCGAGGMADPGSNGMLARTALNTTAARTHTGTANEITVSDGNGVAGNPTYSLPAALTFTGKTITGGTYNSVSAITVTDLTVSGTCTGCGGGGGSVAWSAITNPAGALALTMAANTTTLTYNNATSTANLFRLTDTASNSGTGKMMRLDTASASNLRPFSVEPRGSQALLVDHLGNVVAGLTSRTTSDTDGWLYLPSVSGQNINVPTTQSGFAPIYLDTAAGRLRGFYSSNWNVLGMLDPGANGVMVRTSANTTSAVTITGTANEISVANGNGVAGNPTLSLPAALTFTGKTITGGTYASVSAITVTNLTVSGSCTGCGSTSLPVVDTTNIVTGSADATKIMRFEVDGFTTATTRVKTFQDTDGTIAELGAGQSFTATNVFSDLRLTTGGAGLLRIQTTSAPGSNISLTINPGTASRTVTLNGAVTFGGNVTTSGHVTIGSSTDTVTITTSGNTNFAIPVSGTAATLAGAETFTNKTYDASATGNNITLSSKIGFLGAGCNNTTAGTAWDLPTSNAASASCRTPSANTQRGLLDFASGATNIAFNTFKLPADWVVGTGFDAEIVWQSASTSGNVVWEISIACAGSGDADDVTTSYQAFSASAANGTANRLVSATKSNITTTGSCAAGDLVTVAVRRQGGTGSDTMTTNPARLSILELTYWRTL